jgi:hypothetical protein
VCATGNDVDWWVAIKPSGTNLYLYMDPESGGFRLSTHTVDGQLLHVGQDIGLSHAALNTVTGGKGAVARTMEALVTAPDNIVYNDQPRAFVQVQESYKDAYGVKQKRDFQDFIILKNACKDVGDWSKGDLNTRKCLEKFLDTNDDGVLIPATADKTHTKGGMTHGFWLVHSVPNYPATYRVQGGGQFYLRRRLQAYYPSSGERVRLGG